MHNLQLTLPRITGATHAPGLAAVQRYWLRARRRIVDAHTISERRRFEAVRMRFYNELWRDAAADVGAALERLPNGVFRISRLGRSTFVDRSELMLDSRLVDRVLLDKGITYRWLAAKGLRTVAHARFGIGDLDIAERFLDAAAGPVVVKPADETGCGHGVTTGIEDRASLRAAARNAAAFHRDLLVERQLSGASFRLLFLDGRFIDAVRRDSPIVTGDGRSSIAQLVRHENELRRTGDKIVALSPLVIDLECRNTLASTGMNPTAVLSSGVSAKVKLAVNENSASQNHIVRDDVHPAVIAAGERLTRELRLGLAGLDVTATDISAPPEHPDTVFNEVNIGAGLHHHYLVADPSRIAHVAPRILEHILTTGHGAIDL